jgi:hypothetical protein
MPDDYGPNTGEMGTAIKYVEYSRMAADVLYPLEKELIRMGHTGSVDVSVIVDEDGNPKGDAWYFSPKLMSRKNYDEKDEFELKIETKFYVDDQFDAKGEPVEISPLEFLNKKHFKFRGSIKVDKVYIGSTITLQCKVYDGVVQPVENKRKRMVRIGQPSGQAVSADDDVLLLEDD